MDCFLVTGANGDIGEAIGRILIEAYPDARVVGADCSGEWPGRAVFAEVHGLPRATDAEYLDALRALTSQCGADLVIPASVPEIERLAASEDRTGDLPLLMNRAEQVLPFLDKLSTAQWLAANGLAGPATKPLSEAGPGDLPVVVKPRWGSGSRGIEIARTPERLAVIQAERDDDAVAQALLEPDDEYTCALFRKGGALRTLIMRRWLGGGLTVRMTVERDDEIEDLVATVATRLDLDGVLNVQLRRTADGPRVFEINPRLSSTVMMRHRLGFTDLAWWIEARNGRSLAAYRPPVGHRAWRLSREVTVAP